MGTIDTGLQIAAFVIAALIALYWVIRLVRDLWRGNTPPPSSGYSFRYTKRIQRPAKIRHRFTVNTATPQDPDESDSSILGR